MRKVLTLALLAVAAAAALVLPLGASAARTHAVDSTVVSSQVATIGGYAVDAGRVKPKKGAEGAALIRTKSTGANTLALKFKTFFPAGMQQGAGSLTFTPQPNGTVIFTGSGHYTGGTGRFKGVSGHVKINGTLDTATGLTTARVTGTAKY